MSAILISLNFNWIKEMVDSRIAEIRLLDKLQNSLNVCGTLCQREINIYLCIFVLFFSLSSNITSQMQTPERLHFLLHMAD